MAPTLSAIVAADALVKAVAERAQEIGREVEISFGVDDAISAALRRLPGAIVRTTVYARPGDEPYAITSVNAVVGYVEMRAQFRSRPATAEESRRLDSEDAIDHRDSYRSVRS